MKKTLLSLLTTVAFAAPTFAADALTDAPQEHDAPTGAVATAISEAIEAELNNPSHQEMGPQLRKVLNGQSDLNAPLDNSLWTPASFAAYHGMFNTLKALAQMGSKLVIQEGRRLSPLHSAVNRFSVDQFSELLNLAQQQGFDVNSQGTNMSLLYSAVNNPESYPSLMMVEWLINNGARTDLPATLDDKTYLPLCAALCIKNLNNREEIVALLKTGLTAEQIAEAQALARAVKAEAEDC